MLTFACRLHDVSNADFDSFVKDVEQRYGESLKTLMSSEAEELIANGFYYADLEKLRDLPICHSSFATDPPCEPDDWFRLPGTGVGALEPHLRH